MKQNFVLEIDDYEMKKSTFKIDSYSDFKFILTSLDDETWTIPIYMHVVKTGQFCFELAFYVKTIMINMTELDLEFYEWTTFKYHLISQTQ